MVDSKFLQVTDDVHAFFNIRLVNDFNHVDKGVLSAIMVSTIKDFPG